MTLRFAAFESDWKQTALLVDNRVGECCPTTAAMTGDGPIVAHRNRSDQEMRDIYVFAPGEPKVNARDGVATIPRKARRTATTITRSAEVK